MNKVVAMINEKYMPEDTANVFMELSSIESMCNFTLIGGTAMAIQIGHRLSEDLDFWMPKNNLPKNEINKIMGTLRSKGMAISMLTPSWRISQAKINGIDLLSYSQDYSINDVKVTFFARNDEPYLYFSQLGKITAKTSFGIADLNSIFEMKSWVISQRVKSRDLFDLMIFVKNGKSIQDILDAGFAADLSWNNEYAKDVLVGNIPIDKDDEGLYSVLTQHNNKDFSIENIHQYFQEKINDHEIELSQKIASLSFASRC